MSEEVLHSDLGIPEWDPEHEPSAASDASAAPADAAEIATSTDMGTRFAVRSADGTRAMCTIEVLPPFMLSV